MNWLGDAVMALPAIERLREARPASEITLLTAGKLAELFTHHPAIDRVIGFEKSENAFAVARRVRGAFDLAVILPNSFRSALEVWLASIPSRVGYGGNARGFLLSKRVRRRAAETRMHKRSDAEVRARIAAELPRETFRAEAHHIHNYLHLVSALGADARALAPRIAVQDAEREGLRQKLSLGSGKRIFGINPGAEYGPAKRWPIENFIAAAKSIGERSDCEWLIFGGPNDREAAGRIKSAVPGAVNLAGATTLRELCVGLSLCEAVITNDTGPMHVAAAVGARVIVPFGSTSPELTGPGLPGRDAHALIRGGAACAPCFRRVCPVDFRCMQSITPKMVADAVLAS